MKKLLVLVLVCALASVANAALSLSIVDNGDGTFGILQTGTFVASTDNSYFFAVAPITGTVPTAGALTAGAPVNSAIFGAAVENGFPVPEGLDGIGGSIGKLVASGTENLADGLYVELVQCAAGVTVQIYTCDQELGNVQTMGQAVTLTPEPMTMGLLGLGGLFLRRRSK